MKISNLWGLLLSILVVISSCEQKENVIINEDNSKRYSNTISLEDARVELEKLLSDICEPQSTKSTDFGRKVIANAFTIKDETCSTRLSETEMPIIHVFNFENEGGFAIMSGNSELPSLLALTDSGEIKESEAIDNPGFALLLENMEKICIDEMSASTRASNNYKVYGEWENIVYKQGGYCKVTWGQSAPYNRYCPLKDGVRTVTGCVATAVAQFMSIYKYPSSY